jgi:tight adherence protein C
MYLFSGLIFIAVIASFSALYFWKLPRKIQGRLDALLPATLENQWIKTVAKVMRPFAVLSAPDGDWEKSPLRKKFITAGFLHGNVHLIFFGSKTVLPLIFAGLAFFMLDRSSPMSGLTQTSYVLFAATVGCYLPNLILNWRIRHRQREVFETFPDVADLLLVCIEAGLGIDAALNMVTDEIRRSSRIMADELHLSNLEIRAGGSREKSLQHLALRTGVEEIMSFAAMLTQAEAQGASIGDSLRVFSRDLRHKRQLRAEVLASKMSTKMLFPLVLFIFPNVMLVILGPAAIQIMRTMTPALGAN